MSERADQPFPALALHAIEATAVPRLLHERDAVVLERIAYGAGATYWYFVERAEQLATLADRFRPGSCLSFYFDGRIARAELDADVADEILRIAARDHGAVVGRLGEYSFEIEVDFPAGRGDLEDFTEAVLPGERIFFGPFPARDNDAVDAVTLDLPDRDGVVRPHRTRRLRA